MSNVVSLEASFGEKDTFPLISVMRVCRDNQEQRNNLRQSEQRSRTTNLLTREVGANVSGNLGSGLARESRRSTNSHCRVSSNSESLELPPSQRFLRRSFGLGRIPKNSKNSSFRFRLTHNVQYLEDESSRWTSIGLSFGIVQQRL